MAKQKKLPVLFRKWPESKGGSVIAILPTLPGTNDPYTSEMYEHVGQHGAGDPVGVVQATKKANPVDYDDLLKELRDIGYRNMEVKQRLQASYLADRKRQLARVK